AAAGCAAVRGAARPAGAPDGAAGGDAGAVPRAERGVAARARGALAAPGAAGGAGEGGGGFRGEAAGRGAEVGIVAETSFTNAGVMAGMARTNLKPAFTAAQLRALLATLPEETPIAILPDEED